MGKNLFEAIGYRLGQKAGQAKNAFHLMGGTEEESLRAEIRLGRDLATAFMERVPLIEENAKTRFAVEVGSWLAASVKEKKLPFSFWPLIKSLKTQLFPFCCGKPPGGMPPAPGWVRRASKCLAVVTLLMRNWKQIPLPWGWSEQQAGIHRLQNNYSNDSLDGPLRRVSAWRAITWPSTRRCRSESPIYTTSGTVENRPLQTHRLTVSRWQSARD